ncbi:MAG: phosphoglycerate mutase, partial [Candidatus Njordarchaeota archaeon]
MKVILIIIDGAGDEYIPQLDGTPLQYASKKFKFINRITKEGLSGIMHPVSPGVPPSSDIGHLSIFGYNIEKEYPGRGYFEAMGAGIKPKKGEVAFRVNLATVTKKGSNLIVVDRRAGRISGNDASQLYNSLDSELQERGIPARVIHTLEHRGVLLIRGDDLIGAVTDTDPHELNAPILAAEPWKELDKESEKHARKTAKILNEITKMSFDVLDKHQINRKRIDSGLPPANIILARGGGIAKSIMSFEEKWGSKPAFIAAGALYKGIARALGMHEITVEGATGTSNTNLE